MVLDRGDGGAVERIPDSLQALIGARIDRLPPAHRSVLRRAAVIGRVFWAGAIERLSPDLEDVGGAIDDLLLRDFLLPEARSSISGEVAFRFKHVLIREVAYAGLSKSARGRPPRPLRRWLKERAGDELIKIRAYHLDHAVELLEELDGAPRRSSRTRRRRRSMQPANAPWRARRTARPGSCSCALRAGADAEHRYRGRGGRQAAGRPSPLSAEMELVARDAEEAGELRIYGLALWASRRQRSSATPTC